MYKYLLKHNFPRILPNIFEISALEETILNSKYHFITVIKLNCNQYRYKTFYLELKGLFKALTKHLSFQNPVRAKLR